jgi:hypothetical protein
MVKRHTSFIFIYRGENLIVHQEGWELQTEEREYNRKRPIIQARGKRDKFISLFASPIDKTGGAFGIANSFQREVVPRKRFPSCVV